MTFETFFDKFDQFADAPNVVAKLRELVLSLAVTGRLGTYDEFDNPAYQLLESIRVDRAKLVEDRKIKIRLSKPVAIKEQPFALPRNWVWARLSDVGYELGQKMPTNRFTYIDVGSINSDKGLVSDRAELLEANEAPSRARKLVSQGTVIYSTVRPYLLNIAIIDRDFELEPIVSTAFAILHPFSGINNRFLFYWLRSRFFTEYVQESMKGMAYPAINDEKFYSGFIPLPPLAEQRRIVAKVDELMALCDRLEVQLQARETQQAALARAALARFADAPTPANLELLFYPAFAVAPADLRKSILTLAVQGKLVPQDPNDEPAEVLLEKVRAERLTLQNLNLISLMKSSPVVEEAEYPFSLWPGWALVRLIEIVVEIRTGPFGSSLHQSDYQQGGIPVINPASLKDGKIIPIDEMAIDLKTLERLESFKLNTGDIVMARRGEMGRCAIVTKKENGWLCGTGSLVLRMPTDLYTPFVTLLIGSPYSRGYLGSASVGTTMQNLNQAILGKMPIALPPLAEQRRIVAKVDELMALVDQLEAQLATARTRASQLLDAMIAELTAP